MVGDFGYAKFKMSPKGQKCLQIVAMHAAEIEVLAKHGVAPVKTVDDAFADFQEAGNKLSDSEKQFVGRMVYEQLGTDTWEVSGRQEFGGKVFVSGATFDRRAAKLLKIRRKSPRLGGDEYPIRSARGYQLVRADLPPRERTLVENAIFVGYIEEAIPLINAGYHVRMGRESVRPSLIGKESLIIE